MPAPIPDRFPARTEDLALHLMAAASVPVIHAAIDLDGPLDGPRLRRAHRLLLDAEPLLGCRYVARFFRSHWRRLDRRELDSAELLLERSVPEQDWDSPTNEFLGQGLPADRGPRMRTLWLRGGVRERLVIAVHHQAADAGGVKEVLYRLAGIYHALGDDPDHAPEPRLGSRSLRQVFAPLFPRGLPMLAIRLLHDTWYGLWPPRHLLLPMGTAKEGAPGFRILHIAPQRMAALRRRHPGATVNDLVCAAYLRAVARVAGWSGRDTLRLWGTVDLRRYLPGGHADALCNLSGFMYLNFGSALGERYEDTLALIRRVVGRVKAHGPGLGHPLSSWLIMLFCPHGVIDWAIPLFRHLVLHAGGMPPVLTNMGAIDSDALDFGAPPVRYAHLVVPAAFPAASISGLSGFRGGLTLTAGYFASALPEGDLGALFAAVDEELSGA